MASSSFTLRANPLTGHAYSAQWHIYQARLSELPVAHQAKDLIRELEQVQVLILIGQTGSGKRHYFLRLYCYTIVRFSRARGP